MSTNRHETNGEATYEKADVSIRGIVLFVVGLDLATALSMWLMSALFGLFGAREARDGSPRRN